MKPRNLIAKDFTALIQLLYKIDVDEKKLKRVLNEKMKREE